jgi:hypothetical protein
MIYQDESGAIYRADHGLGGKVFMTLRQIGQKGNHRVKSSALPLRDTLEEAQADLDFWAKKKGLIPIDPVNLSDGPPRRKGVA